MNIFFVRHGDSRNDRGITILSDYGKKQMEKTASFLKTLNLGADQTYLLTSPQLRAVSSAEIIREMLCLPEPLTKEWLDCNARGCVSIDQGIEEFVDQTPACRAIVVISHQSEVMYTLRNYGKDFGQDFRESITEGSVHWVDTDAKWVTKLFEP